MKKFIILLAIGVLTLVMPGKVNATIINGGFESDFASWSTIGDTGIATSAFGSGPTEGAKQALLTTAPDFEPDVGMDPASISAAALETFLGLTSGTLLGLGHGTPFTGTGIKQTFSANAGDIISFDWNFLSDEVNPVPFEGILDEFAFFTFGSTATSLASVFSSTFFTSPTIFFDETGFFTTTITIPTTGEFMIGFGVVDVEDDAVNSALLVDNIHVVPEPGTLTLLGIGLVGLVGASARRRIGKRSKA